MKSFMSPVPGEAQFHAERNTASRRSGARGPLRVSGGMKRRTEHGTQRGSPVGPPVAAAGPGSQLLRRRLQRPGPFLRTRGPVASSSADDAAAAGRRRRRERPPPLLTGGGGESAAPREPRRAARPPRSAARRACEGGVGGGSKEGPLAGKGQEGLPGRAAARLQKAPCRGRCRGRPNKRAATTGAVGAPSTGAGRHRRHADNVVPPAGSRVHGAGPARLRFHLLLIQ